VVSAALGFAGISGRFRLRVAVTMIAFEGLMPIVGAVVGSMIARGIGGFSGYLSAIVLAGVALAMVLDVGRDREGDADALSARARGILGLLALGFSVSVDELGIGLGGGLFRLSLPVLVGLIAVQAIVASQAGFYAGSRVSARMRESTERLAALLLAGAAALILIETIIRP